jgi:hypothetical protein
VCLFLAAFVVGVTFLNLHDSAFFERRATRAKAEQENWAVETLARMWSSGRADTHGRGPPSGHRVVVSTQAADRLRGGALGRALALATA